MVLMSPVRTTARLHRGKFAVISTAIAVVVLVTSASAHAATVPPPAGVPGSWTSSFDTEFSRSPLSSKWTTFPYDNSNVQGNAADVSVSGGYLNLILSAVGTSSSYGSGGFVQTSSYRLPVGGFMQARIELPGPGTTPGTSIDNWSGFWASGSDWPNNGEEDVVESLGAATSNYHSPQGASNSGTIPGNWSNSFHTYGLYRGATSCTVYYDGKVVRTYPTHDDGGAQEILLDAASSTGPDATIDAPTMTGSASAMKVDYVRAWVPAG